MVLVRFLLFAFAPSLVHNFAFMYIIQFSADNDNGDDSFLG